MRRAATLCDTCKASDIHWKNTQEFANPMLSEKTSVQLCSFARSTVLMFFQTTAVKLYQDHLVKHMLKHNKMHKLNEILELWSMVQTYIFKHLSTTASHSIRLLGSFSVPSKFARLSGKTHAWHWLHQWQQPNLFQDFCISAHSHDKYWLVQSVSISES